MVVYVDSAKNTLGRMKMSHMSADTVEELHAMAEQIGLKREWFQDHSRYPHYDVSQSKRKLAVKAGAIEVSSRQLVQLLRAMRVAQESVA
jgi:hypothetical protein